MKRIYVIYSKHQCFTSWEKANEYYNMLATSEKKKKKKWRLDYDGNYVSINNESNIIYIDWENWQIFESPYEVFAEDFTDNYFTKEGTKYLIEKILACNGDNDK